MDWTRIARREFLKTWGAGAAALALPEIARPLLAAGLQETHPAARDGNRTTVAEDVGTWVEALHYEDLPRAVVEKAKRVLLDTVGCALGAVDAEPVRFAQQAVFLQGGNPRSTLIGLGRKVSCDQAAFLNGMAIRYLDYNDYADPGGHPSINVAPALAVAEMRNLTGKDLILGTAIGHEVHLRLGEAADGGSLSSGWDLGTIMTNYSSAAVAGKLLGLTGTQIANAMAIAGAHGNTLAEVRRGAVLSGGEMTPSKGTADPMSARNGTFAAMLAQEGMTYPLTIFEGVYGFGKKVIGELREDILRKRTGDFQILKSGTKMWPCFFHGQAPIAAALEVRGKGLNPAEIETITVLLNESAYENQQAFKSREITVREQADHSVPYVVARALLDGNVVVDDFEERRFREPGAVDLVHKATLRMEPALTSEEGEAEGAYIEVKLRGGAVLRAEVPHPPGSVRNPASDAALLKKFMALAEEPLGKGRAEAAAEALLYVDQLSDLGPLMGILTS
jgi:2-methylcitrate dehydratase